MSEIILPIHLLILAFIAWNVILADHMGFDWMRGKKLTLDVTLVNKYHKRVWIGLILMIVSGLIMFWPIKDFLFTRTQFWVKMGFVLALVINSFAIGNLSKVSTQKSFASLTKGEKFKFLLSGAVSTICWLGAAAGGFYLLP